MVQNVGKLSEDFPRTIESIPEGWGLVKLAEVCYINPSKPPSNALPPDTPVTFVPMPAVDAKRGEIIKAETRSFSKVRKGYTSFCEGDVIMAKITPCMENGKAAIARSLQNGLGFGSTEFHVLRSNEAVVPEFIYHFIRQGSFRREAEGEMTGSVGQKRVPAAFLEETKIPLPPLAEQKRIMAKVEELLTRVNATKERLAKVSLILKRFRQAVLAAACSGRLTEDWRDKELHANSSNQALDGNEDLPSSWSWRSIRDLASSKKGSIQSGPFGSNLLHSEFQRTGILAIGIDNVLDGKFSFGKQHRISHDKYELLKKYAARPLDVLVTVMATVGRCCVVPSDIETAIITKHVYRISADHNAVNPYYLMQCIRGCPAVLAEMQSETQGVTRPGINGAILKRINIPLPPITEQHEIVRRVEAMFKLADSVEKRIAISTGRAEKLTQAILAKAFRGELVSTEAELARRDRRSYETASELLTRIKSQREIIKVPTSGHRHRVHKRQLQ